MDSDLKSRPLIGVSTSDVCFPKADTPQERQVPRQREIKLAVEYLEAIESAGGIPVIVPPLQLGVLQPLLNELAGVCISGGPDINPSNYGATAHPELGPTESALDKFEIALVMRADVMKMPVLGICRGMQIINVARGGTLYQHLPEQLDDSMSHRQKEQGHVTTHDVEIAAGSFLEKVTGAQRVDVNTFHHQAPETVGHGLTAVAWSPDGAVEAVEDARRGFFLGVQWHLESLTAIPEHAAIFENFVEHARTYALSEVGKRPFLGDHEAGRGFGKAGSVA